VILGGSIGRIWWATCIGERAIFGGTLCFFEAEMSTQIRITIETQDSGRIVEAKFFFDD
jgi:hypothetical protein